MYIADSINNRLIKLSSTGFQLAVHIPIVLSLYGPRGFALDTAGNMYIADTGNDRIVKLNGDGVQVTVYNNPSLYLPRGIAVDGAGSMYIGNAGGVMKLNSSGSLTIVAHINAILDSIALDSKGNIYVGLGQNLVMINTTGSLITIASLQRTWGEINGIALDTVGNIYILSQTPSSAVLKLNSTGSLMNNYRLPSNTGYATGSITVDCDGNIYIVTLDRCILKMNSSGVWTAVYTTIEIDRPYSIAFRSDGNLYIADIGTNQIVKVNSTGSLMAIYTTNGPTLRSPRGISLDSAGNIYIADMYNNRIVKRSITGSQMAVFDLDGTCNDRFNTLYRPQRISLDAAGNMYIPDNQNKQIVKLDSTGLRVGTFNLTTLNSDPSDISFDLAGYMYVLDSGNRSVVKLNPTGSQLAVYGPINPDTSNLYRIVLDITGNMYIIDFQNARIVKLSAEGEQLAVYTNNHDLYHPEDIALDAAGNLYIADTGNFRVVVLNATGSFIAEYVRTRSLSFYPRGIALDFQGNMYISDGENDRILIYDLPFCLPGFYCRLGVPTICPDGYYCPLQIMNSTSPPTLLPCPSGHYCRNGTVTPIVCPLKFYCPELTAFPVACPAGTFSNHYGLSTANCSGLCELGEYCPLNASQPLPCPAGAYCPTTADYPHPCPPGSYGGDIRLFNKSCSGECAPGFLCTAYSVTPKQQPCPPGTSNNLTGKSECTKCDPGFFAEAIVNGTLSCTKCPSGMYSSLHGSSQCFPCPPGTSNNLTGQSECKKCSPGYFAEASVSGTMSCSECSKGTYTSISGSSQCLACSVGFFSMFNGSANCSSCAEYDGVECQGGVAFIKETYHGSIQISRSSNHQLAYRLLTQRCPIGYCLGTNTSQVDVALIAIYQARDLTEPITFSIPHQCPLHSDQSSFTAMCGQCEEGFAPSDVGSPFAGCVKCDGVSPLKVMSLIGLSWMFVLLYYMVSNGRLGLIGTGLYFVQTIAIMMSSQSSLTAWLRMIGFNPVAAILPSECLGPITPELQYAIPLFIPLMQLIQLFITIVVHFIAKRLAGPAAYVLDELTMSYMLNSSDAVVYNREVKFPHRRWWTTMIRYCLWPELTVSTIIRTIFLIITASFTSVMVTSIAWFSCTDSVEIGFDQTPVSVMHAFPAVKCTTPAYEAWSYIMAAHIAAWSTAIILCGFWLFSYRHQLSAFQRPESSVESVRSDSPVIIKTLVTMALVPQRRTESRFSLWVPLLYRTGFAIYWPSSNDHFDDSQPSMDTDYELDEPVCYPDGSNIMLQSRREYAFRSLFGELFDSFNSQAIGWNIVIWVRRLALIMLSVIFSTIPAAKFMLFSILHIIVCGLHMYYLPYTTRFQNDMELVAIVIHLIIAITLNAYPSPTDPAIQSVILTLTLLPIVTYGIYHIVKYRILGTEIMQLVRKNLSSSDKSLPLNESLLSHSDIVAQRNEVELEYKQ
jgi:sugar lactone lactonase YvrE